MRTADENLAARIRAELPESGVSEVKMFGGLCFMLNGNMVAGTYQGGMMVRVGKEQHAATLRRGSARPMMQRDKVMEGYVIVDEAALARKEDLRSWLDLALAHVRTLPPKEKKTKGKAA